MAKIWIEVGGLFNVDADATHFNDSGKQRRWESMTDTERGRWLIGQMWNCTDQLGSLQRDPLSEVAEHAGMSPDSVTATI